MINPNTLRPDYRKFKPIHRPKRYQPTLTAGEASVVLRAPGSPDGMYKTATEALERAKAVKARWCRLYNAALSREAA